MYKTWLKNHFITNMEYNKSVSHSLALCTELTRSGEDVRVHKERPTVAGRGEPHVVSGRRDVHPLHGLRIDSTQTTQVRIREARRRFAGLDEYRSGTRRFVGRMRFRLPFRAPADLNAYTEVDAGGRLFEVRDRDHAHRLRMLPLLHLEENQAGGDVRRYQVHSLGVST